MTPIYRLVLFVVALALVFGLAVAAGRAVDPVDRGVAPPHDGEEHIAAGSPGGLAIEEGGVAFDIEPFRGAPGQPAELRFSIRDNGVVVTTFDVEQERRMHVIVVGRDLSGFQHLHPEMTPAGDWVTPLTLPSAGAWRVLADFSINGARRTLGADVLAAGEFRPERLPEPTDRVAVDGYDVRLVGSAPDLAFLVERSGRHVNVDPYLGAAGHLVALRAGDLAYLHAHPTAGHGEPRFSVPFPSPGRYRLYFQFASGGTVHTAAFTYEVHR